MYSLFWCEGELQLITSRSRVENQQTLNPDILSLCMGIKPGGRPGACLESLSECHNLFTIILLLITNLKWAILHDILKSFWLENEVQATSKHRVISLIFVIKMYFKKFSPSNFASSYLENIQKDQWYIFKTSGWHVHKWLFCAKKLS